MYNTILFDLDGTLTDSGPGIMNSVQYAVEKFGIKNPDRDILRKFVGPPLVDSFKRYFKLSEESAKKAVEYYREYYSAGGIFENSLYDGIDEVLRELSVCGYKIYLATSKPQVFAVQILEHFDILKYFDGIVGSFLDGTRINKQDIIKEIILQEGITEDNIDRVLMVGDREYDIIGAHKCNIKAVGVLYGYGSKDEFKKVDADYIIDKPEQILKIVNAK